MKFLFTCIIAVLVLACGEAPEIEKDRSIDFATTCEVLEPDYEEYPEAYLIYNAAGDAIGFHLEGNAYKDLCTDEVYMYAN